eukprot:CAMPEP_0206296706 /NCGR_PEP_ID=MMETSP0106_2-20121207/5804_1 /ASSEMBLY_ACC=CAM_ASM_000206 /TAXON_ID=81532 /ORGANISM="Acanthoeca-like sp., Strain 10tr" /LENGTH=943 /DNA_ID=CAMNT_0053727367 /DNA_START=100 /DNA_END=2932 /DNA_ORIENTATION=-
MAVASATVTCNLTVDNVLTGVWYNGAPLEVRGNQAVWTQVKTISFNELGSGGGILEITGHEAAGCGHGCTASGLLVTCRGGTAWDGYVSNSNPQLTQAYGSCRPFQPATVTPSMLAPPCVSTSGFFLAGSGTATKVWPAAGGAYAYFRQGARHMHAEPTGTTASAGCAELQGLEYSPFGQYLVAAPTAGTNGACAANGTVIRGGADVVCGTATFYLQCSAAAVIQAVAIGEAAGSAGNDDSFYAYLDGNRTAARTVHTGYRVGAWQPSVAIFGGTGVMLSPGRHNLTLAEREDGTRVRSMTLVRGGQQCRFVPPPPRCTSLPAQTAGAGCARIAGFVYYAQPPPGHLSSPPNPSATAVSGGAFCFRNGTTDGRVSGDRHCGTATFHLRCTANVSVQAALTARALLSNGGDDSFYAYLDGNRAAARRVNTHADTEGWGSNNQLFAAALPVTAGNHTVTISEREDGTQLKAITLTQGYPACAFVEPPPLTLARPPLPLAVPTAATVTCQLTIDNVLSGVWYNGASLIPTGPLDDWTRPKSLTFEEVGVGGGALVMTGREASGCHHGCTQSGLLMTCTGGQYWDGFVSNTDPQLTQAYGNCSAFAPAAVNAAMLAPPCISTSGFAMADSGGAAKVWPANGGAFAYFQLTAGGAPQCSIVGGATAFAGCAQVNGLLYNSFRDFLVAPPAPRSTAFSGYRGYCFANGTASGQSSGDAVCGAAVFSIVCSAAAVIQATVNGSATLVAWHDDSFYVFVDGNRSAARTVHAGYRVGSWRTSPGIFAGGGVQLSPGAHTITLAEREDGTRIHSISLTSGQQACRFVMPPSTAPTIPVTAAPNPGGVSAPTAAVTGGRGGRGGGLSTTTDIIVIAVIVLGAGMFFYLFRTNRATCFGGQGSSHRFHRLHDDIELEDVTNDDDGNQSEVTDDIASNANSGNDEDDDDVLLHVGS